METTEIREVVVQYKRKKKIKMSRLTDPKDAAAFFRTIMPCNTREHFLALFLDGNHQPIGYSLVGTGTADRCSVHPREVYQRAIAAGALAVIIAHNHPSGNVTPSPEDVQITTRMKEAGKVLGISLLDHLVITENDYQSATEEGRF